MRDWTFKVDIAEKIRGILVDKAPCCQIEGIEGADIEAWVRGSSLVPGPVRKQSSKLAGVEANMDLGPFVQSVTVNE